MSSPLLTIEAARRRIVKRNSAGDLRPVSRDFFLKHVMPLVRKTELGCRVYIEEVEIDLFLIKSKNMTLNFAGQNTEVKKVFQKSGRDSAYIYDRKIPVPKRRQPNGDDR